MNFDVKGQLQRFTARTRVYTLAILGVTVGGVYLSIALFLALSDRIGAVNAALATGVCVIFVGAIPWLLMSFGRYDPPSAASAGTAQPGSRDDNGLQQAQQLGDDLSRQLTETVRKHALVSVGAAVATGLLLGSSPRARKTIADLISNVIEEQSRRR